MANTEITKKNKEIVPKENKVKTTKKNLEVNTTTGDKKKAVKLSPKKETPEKAIKSTPKKKVPKRKIVNNSIILEKEIGNVSVISNNILENFENNEYLEQNIETEVSSYNDLEHSNILEPEKGVVIVTESTDILKNQNMYTAKYAHVIEQETIVNNIQTNQEEQLIEKQKEDIIKTEENELVDTPNAKILLALNVDPKIVKIMSSKYNMVKKFTTENIAELCAGKNYYITGFLKDEQFYLITLFVATRFFNKSISYGRPTFPSVLIVADNDKKVLEQHNLFKQTVSTLGIKVLSIYSNTDMEKSQKNLTNSFDICIIEQYKLAEIINNKLLNLDKLRILVTLGLDDIISNNEDLSVKKILASTATNVQKVYFAPANTEASKNFIISLPDDIIKLDVDILDWCKNNISKQQIYALPAIQKFSMLMHIINNNTERPVIVFANTWRVAEWLCYKFIKNNKKADVLTNPLTELIRKNLFKKLNNKELDVLILTDVCVDTLPIAGSALIVSFDVPEDVDNYLKRTNLLQKDFVDVSHVILVCEDYGFYMKNINKMLELKIVNLEIPAVINDFKDLSDFPFDQRGKVKPIWLAGYSEIKEDNYLSEQVSTTDYIGSHRRRDRLDAKDLKRMQHKKGIETPIVNQNSVVNSAEMTERKILKPKHVIYKTPIVSNTQSKETNKKLFTNNINKETHHRRDDRAKDAIEQAITAARFAAEKALRKTQPPVENIKNMLLENHIFHKATEQIELIINVVQEKTEEKLGSKLPFVSRLLKNIKTVVSDFNEKNKKNKK